MNVLVAIISTFPREKKEIDYSVRIEGNEVATISASHTNESVLRSIVGLEQVKETGGLGKIIALVSDKVCTEKNCLYGDLTAQEYYQSVKDAISSQTHFDPVPLERDGTEREIADVLSEICQKISQEDVVYFDSAGGRRTTSNILQLLIKLLRYKEIKSGYSLYADINGQKSNILDTSEFEQMSSLVDAFNEFMTSGKSNQLRECFKEDESEEVSTLLHNMVEFSDRIQLGDVSSLERTILNLSDSIEKCQELQTDSKINIVILKEFLPIIKEKLIGRSSTEIDYISIVQWCLDNLLIQQALTIFVEKIPVQLFSSGIIGYSGNIAEVKREYVKTRNVADPQDWEVKAFYTDILDLPNPLLLEMKEYLNKNKAVKSEQCQEVVCLLKCIKEQWQNFQHIPKKYSFIIECIQQGRYRDYQRFENVLKVNNKLLERLLGIKEDFESGDDGGKTLRHKFNALEKIRMAKSSSFPFPFVFQKSLDKILGIYYGYIYVKSLRNQINHASSRDNLAAAQKKVLESYGYDFTERTVNAIQDNVQRALKAITDTIEEGVRVAVIDEEITPTTLSVGGQTEGPIVPTPLQIGDVVMAKCVDNKKVQIENHPYFIQLVVDPVIDSVSLIGTEFAVTVQQISKKGKLCQVEYIRE